MCLTCVRLCALAPSENRSIWETEPARLRSRLQDLARNAANGSYVCFLNQLETSGPGSFSECLKGIAERLDSGEKKLPGWTQGWTFIDNPNLIIYHSKGNATREDDLEPILRSRKLDVVIVMGTQAGKSLPPSSMDTRALSIMLLLKHMTADWPHKLHIVSENQLDQTADVAVTPGGAFIEPDFVNTQAFTARCLVAALAYPRLQPALVELFADEDSSDGSPQFDLIPCSVLRLGQKRLPFGVLQQIVSAKFGGWAVAVGTMSPGGDLIMTPGIGYTQVWADSDRVVIIRREFATEKLFNERVLKTSGQRRHVHNGKKEKEHSPRKSPAAEHSKKSNKKKDKRSIKVPTPPQSSSSDDEDDTENSDSSASEDKKQKKSPRKSPAAEVSKKGNKKKNKRSIKTATPPQSSSDDEEDEDSDSTASEDSSSIEQVRPSRSGPSNSTPKSSKSKSPRSRH